MSSIEVSAIVGGWGTSEGEDPWTAEWTHINVVAQQLPDLLKGETVLCTSASWATTC